jgi:hypothetical protein
VFVVYPHDGIIYVFSNMKFMILLFMLLPFACLSAASPFTFYFLLQAYNPPIRPPSRHHFAPFHRSFRYFSLSFFPSSTAMKTVYGIFFPGAYSFFPPFSICEMDFASYRAWKTLQF